MAAVDLYGSDASRLRQTYREQLGRDASDDEVSGWLTGSYGGGGMENWIQQISGSDEARRRQAPPSQIPPPSELPEGVQTTAPVIGQNPNVSRPMDDGDPWARAREGLTNTYRQSLGRDPGEGDIDKWLSGQFGYGSGLQDYDKYVQAIMGSPEARAYRPPAPTDNNGYKSIEYWQSQGVPTIDMFDPLTGQLKQGWQRTARGYERTGGAPTGQPTGSAPPPGGYQAWLMGRLGSGPSSPEALGAMESELARYGIRLQKDSFGVIRGRLYLPDGTAVDVVPPGGWGQPWQWIPRGADGHGGGGGGGGRNVGGRNVGGGLPQFGLPGAQFNDPHTKLLEEMMLGRIGQLQSGQDPGYQQLIQYLQQRFKDLQGPGRTGAENEVIRTQALDPIERDRSAARQRMLERLSARGISLESGIAQQALMEIDKAFDAERATAQTSMAANELNRREGRNQYAEGLAAQMYQIPQARNREALGYAGALADLGPQRLQMALQAMGAGGSPQSMFQSLMQLAQMNQDGALLNSRNSSQLWGGLGSLAAILANAGRR